MARIALVTGGSSGIGAACVRRLAADGFRVALTYHSDVRAGEALAEEVGGIAQRLEMRDRDQILALAARVEEELGPVQVLVHNAGVIRDALLPFLSEEDWDEVYEVNLKGPFRLTKRVIKGMLARRWGRVISISSLSGVVGQLGQTHYAAAKAGLIAFTKSVAREAAAYGVTANSIAPGFIETSMLDTLPEKKAVDYRRRIPLRRFGDPNEVAGLVGYLASEDSAYVTGQTFRVDGGMEMA